MRCKARENYSHSERKSMYFSYPIFLFLIGIAGHLKTNVFHLVPIKQKEAKTAKERKKKQNNCAC